MVTHVRVGNTSCTIGREIWRRHSKLILAEVTPRALSFAERYRGYLLILLLTGRPYSCWAGDTKMRCLSRTGKPTLHSRLSARAPLLPLLHLLSYGKPRRACVQWDLFSQSTRGISVASERACCREAKGSRLPRFPPCFAHWLTHGLCTPSSWLHLK